MCPSSKLSSDPFVPGKKSSLCLLLCYTLAHVTISPISLLIRNSLRLLLEDSHIFKTTEYAQVRKWCVRIGTSTLTDEAPIVADNHNVYRPVVVSNGDLFGGGQQLFLERKGHCTRFSQGCQVCCFLCRFYSIGF